MAGSGPELLVSPTDDMGKILSSLHGVPIHGRTNFAAGVRIAQVCMHGKVLYTHDEGSRGVRNWLQCSK